MFCNQCEQVAGGVACTVSGMCGKDEGTAALQDLLIRALRGVAVVAVEADKTAPAGLATGRFVSEALFSTLTNVDFDPDTVAARIDAAVREREVLKARVADATGQTHWPDPIANLTFPPTVERKIAEEEELGSPWDTARDEDVRSLQQTALYGLKGLAAYAYHAAVLGQEDPAVYSFIYRVLAAISDGSLGADEWVGLVLDVGRVNLRVMELLDAANTDTYGHPEPTEVSLGRRAGKAVLVSGHDLADLAALLEQTAGTGIRVYTHGEMLPAHAYPALRKHSHLVGHYGTAWQNQREEFAEFPGAILMTTNCLMPPTESYSDRVFTAGPVNFPDLPHVDRTDFSAVVAKAGELPGFVTDEVRDTVLVGFARNAVLGVAPQVIDAVKQGAIRHFFLVGGCDGARPGRNYYTEFVEKAPSDTVVLTLACGKFRFFDKKLGEIGGIPRLLDVGQCNDAYSAIQIALALADAFDLEVNDLPLSLVLSWYEQKAVAILLTLLHLGIKNIRLGPSLPAFVTPGVLQVLVDTFGIRPIGASAQEDIDEILGAVQQTV